MPRRSWSERTCSTTATPCSTGIRRARISAGDEASQARIAVKFRFHGTSSHAAAAPEAGRSALDAIELTNHAAELLREHTPDFTRIHHVVTAGGNAPNVVPDFGEVFYYIRHPRSAVVQTLYPRLLKCAEAGALATETRLETVYLGGILEIMPNDTLARVARANLAKLNDLNYDETESRFANQIQKTLAEPLPLTSLPPSPTGRGKGAAGPTDVGDVSWVVPTAGFTTACWVPGTSAHSWQAVAAGGTTIGRKGMVLAARVLAATGCDLFQSPALVAAAARRAGAPARAALTSRCSEPTRSRRSTIAKTCARRSVIPASRSQCRSYPARSRKSPAVVARFATTLRFYRDSSRSLV